MNRAASILPETQPPTRAFLPLSFMRRAAIAICSGSLALSGLLSAADKKPYDPDGAIYDRIDKIGSPDMAEEQKREQSAALLDDEKWVQQTWRRINELILKSRYNKPIAKPEEEPKKINEPLDLPKKDAPDNLTDPEYAAAVRARSQLGSLVRALTQLQDSRVPRLIGPLLGETGQDLSDQDTMIPSPEGIAAGTLSAMLSPDGKTTDLPEETDHDGWRRWWEENKLKFGPVLTIKTNLEEPVEEPEEEIIGRGAPKKKMPAPLLKPALPPPVATPPPAKAPEKPIIRAVPLQKLNGAPPRSSAATPAPGERPIVR